MSWTVCDLRSSFTDSICFSFSLLKSLARPSKKKKNERTKWKRKVVFFFLNFVLCVRMLCGAVGSQKLRDGQLSALLERAQRKIFPLSLSFFKRKTQKQKMCVCRNASA
jgi:hypothetical protein